MGESGSGVFHLIPYPRNFAEVTKFSDNIKKPWLKTTLKDIRNIINSQTFLIGDPNKGEPITPCMDMYKANIQSDGSLDKLKMIILVIGDLQNNKFVGDIWSTTASMRTLKYLLVDETKHKARVHHLYFIGAFLQEKVKNKVFIKLDSRYT